VLNLNNTGTIMKKLYLFCFLALTFNVLRAQVTPVTYYTPFHTENQSLWQQGTSGVFDIDYIFFNQTWNNSGTYGGITNIAGYQFGATVTAGTWGEIGSGLEINFGTEQLDIDYVANQVIQKPTDNTFFTGDQIMLNTSFNPVAVPTSNMVTDEYDANITLWLKFGMGMSMSANVCVFSCTNFPIFNINLPTDTYDIVDISSTNGVTLLEGLYHWELDDYFPWTDSEDIITIDIDMPSNAGANVYLHNKNLHSFANPTDPYFDVYFSIPKFIGALNIPYVSAFFGNLSNSWSYGPFYLSYTLMEAGFYLGLYHKQHLTLYPTMKGRLDLPTRVDYAIVHPTNGTVLSNGFDSIINYTVGQRVRINYPCNYDYMDIVPSFRMENQFTNHTYDSIALDFVFDMLAFDIGMNSVTVIPEICIPIYYPCGPWYCVVCDWCYSHSECTPAVVFPGFNWGFGPLVHWQPNLFNIKYNWCNNTWEMQGFNQFPNQAPFRLQPRKMSVAVNTNDVLCYGNSTGSATAVVTNGKPPYIFQWSNGAVVNQNSPTNTQTGFGAGTHFVTVKDANGCMVFEGFIINEPENPLLATSQYSDPNCFDSFDGFINSGISGGTPLYSYNWSHGPSTPDVSGLDAGAYSLTVTDNNGCILTQSWVLTKPDDIIVDIESQNVLCHGDNSGWIILDVDGGIPPYTYGWSNSETTNMNLNLTADSYTVTVTDEHLCSKIHTIVIDEPTDALATTTLTENVSCFGGSNGWISTSQSGGTPPYSYQWYDASNTILNNFMPELYDISAGNYSLIVTDSNGCTDSLSFTLTQPDALQHSFTVQDVLCWGYSTGSIDISLSGATPPFTYIWSGGQTSSSVNSLPAGNYSVTVTDSNGCEYYLETTVTQPAAELTSSTIVTDVRCYGDSTGHIDSDVIGGTPPYTYLWSNGQTTSSIDWIPAGTYTLTVTDNNGCVSYSGGTVEQPNDPITIDATIEPALCFGDNNGSISLIISGGTLPYTLIWDDDTYIMQTNQQTITNLPSGPFNFTVTDANGCIVYESYTISEPDPVTIDFVTTPVHCFNGNDGTASAIITGGTQPYSYEWSNGSTQEQLTGVTAGMFSVTITDQNDCQYYGNVEIGSFPALDASWEIEPVSCKDLADASIHIIVAGGAGNYTYQWNTGAVTPYIEQIGPGDYTIIITDENLCDLELNFSIAQVFNECMRIPSSFTPNGDGINETWVLGNIDAYEDAKVQIFNKWGNLLYETRGQYIPWDGKWNGNPLPSETYYYIIDLGNGDDPYTGTVSIIR
jgi:gliding motility-associated-like protein